MSAISLASRAALMLLVAVAAARPGLAAPSVVASVKPVHGLVAAVMQDVGEPRLLLRGGQSPHTYSLKPSDAAALETADLVVWVGPELESFLARPLRSLSEPGRIMRLTRLDEVRLLQARAGGVWEREAGHEHGHGDEETDEPGVDPHVWLDPDNAVAIVDAVAARLAAIDPANAAAYTANAERARAAITAADRDARTLLSPVRGAPYLVFHDAYQYFERHYGLNAAGAVAVTPDRPPGARRLYEIRERLGDLGVRCVFREPQFPPDLLRTVVDDMPVRVGILDPLGAALPPGPEFYPRLLRAMAQTLADCLSGDD